MNSECVNDMDEENERQQNFSIKVIKQKMKITESEEIYRLVNFGENINNEKYCSYFKCTKCDESFKNKIEMGETISIHPILKVLMCDSCCDFYGDGNFSMGSDGEDKYCRWCGEGGTIFSCSKCVCGFCENCIKKHFGGDNVKKIEADNDWKCYFCDPRPLWFLRGVTFLAKRISKRTRDCMKQKQIKKSTNENEEIRFSGDNSASEINNSAKYCKKKMKISSFNGVSSKHINTNSVKSTIIAEDQHGSSHEDTDSDPLLKDNIRGLWKIVEIVSEIGLNESKANLQILQEPNNLRSFINLGKECEKLKTILSLISTFLNKASDSIILMQRNSNSFNQEELNLTECSLWIETIKRFINSKEFKSPFTLKLLASALNSALGNLKATNLNEGVKSLDKQENVGTPILAFAEIENIDEEKNHSTFKFSCGRNDEKIHLTQANTNTANLFKHHSSTQNLHNQSTCSNLSLERDDEMLEQKSRIMDKKNFFDTDWEDSYTESSSDCGQTLKVKEKNEAEYRSEYSKNFSESILKEEELQKLLKMSNLGDKKKEKKKTSKKIKKPQKKLPETDNLRKKEEETLMNFFKNGENYEKKNYQSDKEIENIWHGDFEAGANAGLKSMYLMSSEDSSTNNEKEEEPQKKRRRKKLEEKREKKRRKLKEINYSHYFYSTSSESENEEISDSNSSEIKTKDRNEIINLNINNCGSTKFKDCDTEQTTVPLYQKKGRRNIKRIIKKEFLKLETKEARKFELERKKRITEREKNFEKEFGTDINSKLILDFDPESKKELLSVEENLVEKLKAHQREGVKFMWNCCFESLKRMEEDSGSGCILAHCMGLGKTLQVIALVHTLLSKDTGIELVMIMTPLNILKNWISEFKYWLNTCKYQVIIYDITSCNSKEFRLATIKKWIKSGGVLLIGYEIFRSMVNPKKKRGNSIRNEYSVLLDPGPDVIILDEGHLLKNSNSALNQSVAQIKTRRRIVLTGTPLQNNLREYYCMVHFVKPNILGTKREFENRFVNPIKNGQFEDSTEHDVRLMKRRAHVLHTLLNGFVQRLGYDVLKSFMPEKREYVIKVALTKTQDFLYRLFLEKCIEINDGLLNNFYWLQKIWTHPWILSKTKQVIKGTEPHKNFDKWNEYVKQEEVNDIKSSGKLILLFKILRSCKKLGDKIIVFSQFLKSLDMIEHFLKLESEEKNSEFTGDWTRGINYFRMDGTTTIENRSEFCRKFNDLNNRSARLFLISTRSGGVGINLVAANRVILFDVSWNPMNDLQSIFRIYRFGQIKPCYIYRLIAEGTMEEKIYQRQVTKLSLAHRILDEYQIERHYSQTNLQELYRYEPLPKNKWEIPKLPKDLLFAEILATSKDIVVSYHEHDSLLENREEEELTEEERQAAWKDFEEDRATLSQSTVVPEIAEFSNRTTISAEMNENQLTNGSCMNLVNSEALKMVHQYRQGLLLTPKLALNQNWVLNENEDSICRIVDVRTLTLHP